MDLGNDDDDESADDVEELDWWQSSDCRGFRLTLLPAQHWSRRGLLDTDQTLWGGFVMEGEGVRVYHSGDTAYFNGFREIAIFKDGVTL